MGSLSKILIFVGFGLSPVLSLAQGFNETTTGKQQESSGGISAEEAAMLDKTQQELLQKFRKGRTSSFKDAKSRYSGHLEMHDENLDGITDHSLRKGQTNLEGQMDVAAFKDILDDKKKRDFEIKGDVSGYLTGGGSASNIPEDKTRAVNNAGKCKDGWLIAPSNGQSGVPCQNISSNILDVGAAHGTDSPNGPPQKHRFYKLSNEAEQRAKDAGGKYADRTVQEAATFDAQALNETDPKARVRNVGNDKSKIEYEKDGQTVRKNVAANLDYLRSEYAWLEEQKKHRLDASWKTLRASRLAGDMGVGAGKTDQDLANKVFANRSDDEIAQYIAEKQAFSGLGENYCLSPGSKTPGKCTGADGKPITGAIPLSQAMKDTTKYTEAERNQMWQTAKNNYKTDSPDAYNADDKEAKEALGEVKKCMGRDTWCQTHADRLNDLREKRDQARKAGNTAAVTQAENDIKKLNDQRAQDRANGKPKLFTQITGDVGGAFKDTREFIAARASKAYEGPVDKIIETMKSADFNQNIDNMNANGQANSRPWQEMVEGVKAIKDMQAAMQKNRADWESNDPRYQNNPQYSGTFKFTDKNFNTGTQSVIQMFGINRQRDGSSLNYGQRGPAAPGAPQMQRPRPNFGAPSPQGPQGIAGAN